MLNFAIDTRLFLSTFTLVCVAEIPDKTAIATVLLATKENPPAVFLGAAIAFAIQSAVAVTFGSYLNFVPDFYLKLASGLLFFGFAISMWKRKEEPEVDNTKDKLSPRTHQNKFYKSALKSFTVIFIAEWGDLTQLATATLTAKYKLPWTLFLSSTLALWTVTATAVLIGSKTKNMIHPEKLQKSAAVLFAIFGFYFFYQTFIAWHSR
jgi:putative Ca2+/H+ antiporter (TMEM165/GDT1 family)